MMIRKWTDLAGDQSGHGVIKMAFVSCLVAVAAASTTPGFEPNRIIDKTVTKIRKQLPDTGDKIIRAMGG